MRELKINDELRDLQNVSKEIYGLYDLDKSIIWMVEEFGEFISAIRKGKSKDDVTGELGDLLAWILCISNIVELNISEALVSTFIKEIDRQTTKYGKLKYTDKEINEIYEIFKD